MKNFKKHINRFIILILAIQIMNLSIDARPENEVLLKNSSKDMNRIDNAVEYVFEIVLNDKDAIPENTTGPKDERVPVQFHKGEIFKAVAYTDLPSYTPVVTETAIVRLPHIQGYFYQYCTEINPPPPKFVC